MLAELIPTLLPRLGPATARKVSAMRAVV